MLEIDSLSHSYASVRVLSGVYLRIEPGEVVAIVGRNGCGKTTMLRAIFGSLSAEQMRLSIDGEHVRRPLRTGSTAYLPQESYLPRSLTCARALRLLLGPTGPAEATARVPAVADLIDRRVRDLSGGERRIVELAATLARPARYVLLDEPFTEIEPVGRDAVGDAIRREAREANRGMVVTDHAYRDVLRVADRILVLIGGALRAASGEADLTALGYTPD